MTYISVKCPVCGSEKVYKNGRTKSGKQQYMCNNKNCKKLSFIVDYTYNASKPEIKNKIVPMTVNGSGIRDIARILKISPNTVINHLKKSKKHRTAKFTFVKKTYKDR